MKLEKTVRDPFGSTLQQGFPEWERVATKVEEIDTDQLIVQGALLRRPKSTS